VHTPRLEKEEDTNARNPASVSKISNGRLWRTDAEVRVRDYAGGSQVLVAATNAVTPIVSVGSMTGA
jgi:hypothetical protein